MVIGSKNKNMNNKSTARQKIKFRIRKKVNGVAAKPRLSVFRSNAEIYAQLSTKTKEKLEVRQDSDTAFFKALENVQGEECDQLIISLGYGKNENGGK
jgi:large subunit ribosomal protein L18